MNKNFVKVGSYVYYDHDGKTELGKIDTGVRGKDPSEDNPLVIYFLNSGNLVELLEIKKVIFVFPPVELDPMLILISHIVEDQE